MEKVVNVTAFDLFLSFSLVFLAWQVNRAKDLFVSVVLFIVFGLLMALAWIQLNAPDIALVEASVGAGVTGALFLGVLGRMEEASGSKFNTESENSNSLVFKGGEGLLFVACTFITLILLWSMLQVPLQDPGLGNAVRSEMENSGVENPVTAVILNFRGYDTLLEVGVLLLVAISVYSLFRSHKAEFSRRYFTGNKVLITFMQLMAPFLLLLGFYFLWLGSHAPGGAFQAGSILGGTGILLILGGIDIPVNPDNPISRYALGLGFGGFVIIGLSVISESRAFLEYPENVSQHLVLLVEMICTLSIAAIFISLFKLCAGLTLIQNTKGKSKKTYSEGP